MEKFFKEAFETAKEKSIDVYKTVKDPEFQARVKDNANIMIQKTKEGYNKVNESETAKKIKSRVSSNFENFKDTITNNEKMSNMARNFGDKTEKTYNKLNDEEFRKGISKKINIFQNLDDDDKKKNN